LLAIFNIESEFYIAEQPTTSRREENYLSNFLLAVNQFS